MKKSPRFLGSSQALESKEPKYGRKMGGKTVSSPEPLKSLQQNRLTPERKTEEKFGSSSASLPAKWWWPRSFWSSSTGQDAVAVGEIVFGRERLKITLPGVMKVLDQVALKFIFTGGKA